MKKWNNSVDLYHLDKTSNKVLNLCCDLDYSKFFLHKTCIIRVKRGSKRIRSSKDIIENHILIKIYVPLKTAMNYFLNQNSTTLQLWSCTIIPNFECLLWPWPVTDKAIQYFHQIFWFMVIYHQSKFGCERIISS